jgi:tetratricopeptide (TPR) repeat protein
MRSKKIILPSVFLITLLFHSILYYAVFIKNTPFFNKYPGFASQCLHSTTNNQRLIDFSPLYLWVNIAVQKFFRHPAEILLWMQFILVSGSSVLLFLLLKRFFTTWIALIGVLLFVINRSVTVYTCVFEPEVLLIFFILAFFVLLLKKSPIFTFLSGICFSLILILRLNLFPVVFIVPLYFYLMRDPKKIVLQRIILFVSPVILALFLLSARNYVTLGTFSPTTMNPGTVFYDGNNPNANGWHVVYPPMVENIAIEIPDELDRGHIAYRHIARRINGSAMSISDVNSFWAGKALNFIIDHPLYWCKLVLRKLYAVFNSIRFHDISQVSANDRSIQNSVIPTIPFSLISAMAIIGLILSLRFWRERLVFYAVFLCQICVMILTYSSDRQRLSIIALFIFFASAMLYELTSKTFTIKQKSIAVTAALFLFILFTIKTDTIEEDLYQRNQIQRAHKLLLEAQNDRKRGLLPQASEKNALVKALVPHLLSLRLNGLLFSKGDLSKQALFIAESLYTNKKTTFSSRFDLAVLSLENGKFAQSEAILKDLIREKHTFCRTTAQSSQPHFFLAKIYEKQGRKQDAVAALQTALKNNPGDPWVLSHLAVLTADTMYKNRIVRYFDEIDVEYFMGLAFLDNGLVHESMNSFLYLVNKNPEFYNGLIYLSLLFGANGDYDHAARLFIKVLESKGEPLFAENEISNIFRQWEKQNPQSTEVKFYTAMVMKYFGHYDEALDLFQKVLQENPSMSAIKADIEWIRKAKTFYGLDANPQSDGTHK